MRRSFSRLTALAAARGRRFTRRLMLFGARVSGQGLVEYGLVLVLIMVVCVGILSLVGGTISEVWYDKLINNGAWN